MQFLPYKTRAFPVLSALAAGAGKTPHVYLAVLLGAYQSLDRLTSRHSGNYIIDQGDVRNIL